MPLSKLQLIRVIKYLSLTSLFYSLSSFADDTDLVCSSTDATDCYPRIFQATKDFQDIREGQDIPPGLHVRLNIYDGKREARLNIPMEGENGEVQISDEIPAQNSIITIPTPEKEAPIQETVPSKHEQKPPAYKPEGKIPMPNPTDAETFQSSLQTIKDNDESLDQALDNLSDLSHDIYFGMEIIKDASALQKLVCMAFWLESKNNSTSNKIIGRKAAIIIGSALHNNPGAMKELEPKKNIVMYPSCVAKSETTNDIKKEKFVAAFGRSLKQEQDPIILKTKIVTLSRLLKEPSIRGTFLEEEGMKLLLSIFTSDNDGFNIVRKKISELVMDNFLDEESGADITVWPKSKRSSKKICMNEEDNLEDGCWEHHIEIFSSISPKEKWLKEFLSALKNQRSTKKTKTEL
ncbi:nucleotide exchange factor SIL1 [Blumeria hordei DH14]|uniref:Nucleotide exchange factor SIL1 n=1 Tax=Blumeria graminis f. sp. hordei (strain DH14) TaxID=546991 RepID=N1JDC5_BLUG1|nr:nucleotide exchange factor SIL1 [Blumeria hordei DH14]